MVVEFLRARNVFGRRRAEELVGSVELKEMKGIMRIEGEEQAVIVNEQWLSRVSAANRRVSKLIERECQQLLAMRREGDDWIDDGVEWSVELTMDWIVQPRSRMSSICMWRQLGSMGSRYWTWSTRVRELAEEL